MKTTILTRISILFIVSVLILNAGCATAYMNHRSRRDLSETRTRQVQAAIARGEGDATFEEPSVVDGFNNDRLGHVIGFAVDALGTYLVYDNVIDRSDKNGSVSSAQSTNTSVGGSGNIVTVTVTGSASDDDGNQANDNSRTDNSLRGQE